MGKTEFKIEIDADLLAQAQAAGVEVEVVMEEAVRTALISRADEGAAEARAAKWAEENTEDIEDYNRRIRERGLIGDEFRKW